LELGRHRPSFGIGDLANYVYSHFIGYPVILGVKILLGRSFPASQGFVAKMLSYGILPGTGSIVMIVILLRILGVAISGPVLATLTILVVLVSIYLLGLHAHYESLVDPSLRAYFPRRLIYALAVLTLLFILVSLLRTSWG
jgi:hypothetical protein